MQWTLAKGLQRKSVHPNHFYIPLLCTLKRHDISLLLDNFYVLQRHEDLKSKSEKEIGLYRVDQFTIA